MEESEEVFSLQWVDDDEEIGSQPDQITDEIEDEMEQQQQQHHIITSDEQDDNIIEEQEDLDEEEEEYLVGEEIIPTTQEIPSSLDHIAAENLIYMAQDGNVAIMGDLIEEQVEQVENADYNEQEYFDGGQVIEEVITDDWVQPQGEERVEVPTEQFLGNENPDEDIDVPLPTDQDEYTTSRPYPCDFCSRRFRKKANLMNHMVAHQNDRPHVCNLCGARYIRRCDLMNHLKIHAYVPDQEMGDDFLNEEMDDEEIDIKPTKKKSNFMLEPSVAKSKKTKVSTKKVKQQKFKTESNSSKYDYGDEDMKILSEAAQHHESYYERYPVTDSRKPFVCQHCGVGFTREKAMQSHARIHGGDSPFECETCGEMFWDPNLLNEHQKLHYIGQGVESEYEPEIENENGEESESDADSKYNECYCEICGMSFHRQDLLKRHEKTHVNVKQEKFNSSQETNDSGLSCNVCGDTFAEALDLLAHAEVHARFEPFKCVLCGETFLEENSIKTHLSTTHGHELTSNSCRLCGKLCRDGRTLMKHAWDHSREKNHSCSKCGKTFHNKARLKRHMVSHRNKSVSCDVCGEEFPDGRTLMNHRHSHTNVSGRQFPCKECGKTFGSRSSQQIHVRIHTGERPYGCKFCWKAFADGGTLRKHERIHTGEKPYACPVCPRAFNQRVVLREHIRSHHSSPDTKRGNTLTPYYCTVCNDMFGSAIELIQHLIQHSDMNTAMKRQPATGPRKYKRRRKLKPHELERLRLQKSKSGDIYSDDDDLLNEDFPADDDDVDDDDDDDDDEDDEILSTSVHKYTPKASTKNTRQSSITKSKKQNNTAVYKKLMDSVDSNFDPSFHNIENTLQNIETLVVPSTQQQQQQQQQQQPQKPVPRTPAAKRKAKAELIPQASRPKMIHTQKTRVAVEDGKRKTKTLITRTAPNQQQNNNSPAAAATSTKKQRESRVRPRTKNVNYHILIPDKLPNATFPSSDSDLSELLAIKHERTTLRNQNSESDGYSFELPRTSLDKYNSDIVNDLEEILRSPIKGTAGHTNSMHIMPTTTTTIASAFMDDDDDDDDDVENDEEEEEEEEQEIVTTSRRPKRAAAAAKQKISFKFQKKNSPQPKKSSSRLRNAGKSLKNDSSSSKIVKNDDFDFSLRNIKQEKEVIITDEIYKCEMCSAVFNDRSQLLVHVPIHI